ncbi:dynein heavy chain 17, axonemal [Trichonephila clavipes]|nr:dynein heavy chain 17, axonemal [Trichonephila clavipes]
MQQAIEREDFGAKLIFKNEMNRPSVRFWRAKNLRVIMTTERDSPEGTVFSAVPQTKSGRGSRVVKVSLVVAPRVRIFYAPDAHNLSVHMSTEVSTETLVAQFVVVSDHRDLVNATTNGPRWLILDGDIDPMWIESLNSVMDDNRVLTLASRERISLTPTMRLIFEVSTLERATPATVSRGGVLYLDTADVGWNPYVVSWIERRSVQSEKANLIIFFDKYVPPCLEAMTKRFKTVLPIPDICYVQTLCCLLECLLTPENTPPDSPNELYELYFVFCCVWAFGSGLTLTSGADGRLEFSNWFLSEFKSVKFPISGAQVPGQGGADAPTVFDYYIDTKRRWNFSRINNAPIYVAGLVQSWFDEHEDEVKHLPWGENIIETLGFILERIQYRINIHHRHLSQNIHNISMKNEHPGTDQRDSTDSVHDGPAHLEGAPHHAGGGEWMWKDVCHTVHSGSPGPGIHVSRGERALQLLHVLGHCPAGHGTSSREESGQEFWTTWTEKNNLFHR